MPLGRGLARAGLIAILASFLSACVSVTPIRNPTAPGSDWFVYSSATTGIAIALPKSWRVFDLSTEGTQEAARAWAKGNERAAAQLQTALQRLVTEGNVRFFAADTDQSIGGEQASVAYEVRLPAPAEGLDAFASASQVPGRQVVEQRHIAGDSGDLLMLHIEQRGTVGLTQYQFLVLRSQRLRALFIELPPPAMGAGGADKAQKIGKSFTPIG